MGIETVTNAQIQYLLKCPKKVLNKNVKEKEKGGHKERNFDIRAINDEGTFVLYCRQNTKRMDDFSCGLRWVMPSGEELTLVRYNGSSHPHPNRLEGTKIFFKCHIHMATEEYIRAGLKPTGYAYETDRYSTLDGALKCLVADCNILGIETPPENLDLFTS